MSPAASDTDRTTNERPGIRAQHRQARMSATKAREVLDLIRGKPVSEARTILQFTERGAAETIAKVLDSAVANAANNNDIPPEELFVTSCYADEGPTMKRWRPRARGRATRIRKRTCHITVIVGRYSVEELDRRRERAAGKGRTQADAASSRARRVARSRAAAGTADDAGAPTEEEAEQNPVATEEAGDAAATEEVVRDASAESAEGGTAGTVPTDDENARDAEVTDEVVRDSSAESADDATDDGGPDGGDAGSAEDSKKDED
jgi:large subunit ribosomal protein L22